MDYKDLSLSCTIYFIVFLYNIVSQKSLSMFSLFQLVVVLSDDNIFGISTTYTFNRNVIIQILISVIFLYYQYLDRVTANYSKVTTWNKFNNHVHGFINVLLYFKNMEKTEGVHWIVRVIVI